MNCAIQKREETPSQALVTRFSSPIHSLIFKNFLFILLIFCYIVSYKKTAFTDVKHFLKPFYCLKILIGGNEG